MHIRRLNGMHGEKKKNRRMNTKTSIQIHFRFSSSSPLQLKTIFFSLSPAFYAFFVYVFLCAVCICLKCSFVVRSQCIVFRSLFLNYYIIVSYFELPNTRISPPSLSLSFPLPLFPLSITPPPPSCVLLLFLWLASCMWRLHISYNIN